MKKQLLLFVLACISMISLSAQQNNLFFKAVSQDQVSMPETVQRSFYPTSYNTFQLNYPGVKAVLAAAPKEFTAEAKAGKCVISIPLGDGAYESFKIQEVAMLDAEAAAAFPDIHTYAGISTTDPRRTVRLSTTVRGFRAMVMEPDYSVSFVEPLAWGQTEYYISYKRTDSADRGLGKLRTGVDENGGMWFGDQEELFAPEEEYRGAEIDPLQLKIYRYCVATTGEFSQDHGGNKPEVFAAVTEYSNMVSAIFERDAAVRLQLIAASQNVVFLDPDTDPFFGQMVQDWMSQNPNVLNTYCNPLSHDVGHVYARYLGGSAIGVAGSLGNICKDSKGAGCSAGVGLGDYGSNFLVVIGQEVGHQMNGGHTWNRCNGGGGRHGTVAFEPGSGSTIMSYAGACGSDNVQGFSDLYYHAGSIHEFKLYYTFGGLCGSFMQTDNHEPVVTLPYQNNFTIPISTPFELDGSATDVDGDDLSYCWEEVDAGPEVPLGQPSGNAAIFRTRLPVSVTNRYFPRLATVINNGSDITEQLPTYTRDLTFRLTARDNRPNGGGVGSADVAFKSYEEAGPFLVSYPNLNSAVWKVGEYEEVLWDVANTYNAPVSCKKVNVRLSTDGGLTYPVTLASNVENDGKQYVQVPDMVGTKLRVRVDAADNVFYDISNANFKIENPAQPSLTFGLENDGTTLCLPDYFNTEILSAGILGYSDPITLDLVGSVPPGAVPSFSSTTIQPGESATFSLDLSQVAVQGEFTFDIRGTSNGQEYLRTVTLFLQRNDFSGFSLQTPANGTTNANLNQTLHWNYGLDADLYDIEFSTSPSFNTIIASRYATALDSFKIPTLLQKGTAYFWRVRPINECGTHEWSDPYFFSTFAEDCRHFESNDLPKNLTANGTPTVQSDITVNQGGTISSITISKIDGFHSFFKDLEAHLVGPTGTDVLLWKDRCGNFNGSFDFGLNDQSPNGFPCPPNNTGNIYRPQDPLSPFIGQSSTGTWSLKLSDNEIGSGGTLEAFAIEFCASLTVTPPYLVNNVVMPIPSGTNRLISPDFLLVEDSDNTHDQLIFTMMTEPEDGLVHKNGNTMHAGDQFTQADIDNGLLRFFDYGVSTEPDGFYFMVTDQEGGFFGTPKFLTQAFVGTNNIQIASLDFMLYPNPATDVVQLAFGQALNGNTQIQLIDLAGRLVNNWSMKSNESAFSFNVGELPAGVYFVVVQNEEGRGLKKLVING